MKHLQVVAAIIRRNGRVLITSRRPGDAEQGWEFPGGKLEAGEKPAEGLRRELREELDVDPYVFDMVYRVRVERPGRILELLFLRCTLAPQTEIRPREGQSFRWLAPEALLEVDLLAPDLPVANFLIAGQ